MFSKTCEYAIKVMIYISSRSAEGAVRVGVKEIAEAIDSPGAFTSKVLQQLTRAGLLTSLRGPTGGFTLSRDAISLADIVEAIDGSKIINSCILGFDECSRERPCAVHDRFVESRTQLKRTLENTSLEEIQKIIAKGDAHMK